MGEPIRKKPKDPTSLVMRQFVAFSLIGVLNTGIHFAVYQALLRTGAHYAAASVLGWCCGLVNSYLLNRAYTFRAAWASWPQFVRFTVVNIAALLANLLLLWAVVAGGALSERWAVLPAIACSLVVNFVGNKCWVFARPARVDKLVEVAP